MLRRRNGFCALLFTLGLLAVSIFGAGPASASVKQTHCQDKVCMILERNSSSGRTVYTAYVYIAGNLQGAVARIDYVGYGANGKWKGPQRTVTKVCNPTCAYDFSINYTYAAGDWVYGDVILGNIVEGTPVFSF